MTARLGVDALRRLTSIPFVVACLHLVACTTAEHADAPAATQIVPQQARSEFLRSYHRLQAVDGEEGVLWWADPDVDWTQYTGLMVDPIQLRVPPAHEADAEPRPEIVAVAKVHMHDALIRELGSIYDISNEPGAGVARVRVALVAVDPEVGEIRTWQFVPVTFAASGSSGRDLLVFMEEAISDSVSGKLLSETIQGRRSRESGQTQAASVTAEDIKPALDFWASELAGEIGRMRAGSP